MSIQVTTYKSVNFQNDVNALSFKENNFTFKRTRSVPEGFKNGYNMSHLVKIEKDGFQKPLYTMKIQKDLTVLMILEHNVNSFDYVLTFLRAVRLHQLEEAIESLDVEEVYSAFNFKDFWT
jgi:arabinogalactan endo-1,4-beta-galactosidase